MGTILDSSSSIPITVSIIAPAAVYFDIGLIQFSMITIIAVEIGLLNPRFRALCPVIIIEPHTGRHFRADGA